MPKKIETTFAPTAIGPYSQAILVDNIIYTAGQIALDPETGDMKRGTIEEETEQVINNLRAILMEADSDLDKVIKCTLYLKDINDYETVNTIFERYFGDSLPARSTVEVSKLPRSAKIEVDMIALRGKPVADYNF